MSEQTAVRTYSEAEHAAFRTVNAHERWNPKYEPGCGPAEYASGGYWPGELRRRAAEMERLIPLYRLAANALEREIAVDPRCTPTPAGPASDDGGAGRG